MVRWVWAFVDRPAARFDESAEFWAAVTGTRLSPRRGDHGQFATFLPDVGDACVKLQGVDEGGGAHLDLEFDDFAEALASVRRLGGTVEAVDGDWALVRSPGGYALCVTGWHGASRRPPAVTAPNGAVSRLDQVCLDIGPAALDSEVAFWSALTSWEARPGRFEEFHYLATPPPRPPIRILFQRLDTDRPTSAHLDFACSDIAATRAWHEEHGAHHVADGKSWTVMADPIGGIYCLTGRDPDSGTLPPQAQADAEN